jgi:hypothetical protein
MKVGDTVQVLSAIRLPLEIPIGVGVIQRIDGDLYWVSGFACARTADVLRPQQ